MKGFQRRSIRLCRKFMILLLIPPPSIFMPVRGGHSQSKQSTATLSGHVPADGFPPASGSLRVNGEETRGGRTRLAASVPLFPLRPSLCLRCYRMQRTAGWTLRLSAPSANCVPCLSTAVILFYLFIFGSFETFLKYKRAA